MPAARHVRKEELFADIPGENAVNMASRMIISMLIINQYIRLQSFSGISRYFHLIKFMITGAYQIYSVQKPRISLHVYTRVGQHYDENVVAIFLSIYNKYFTIDRPDIPHVRICVLAMNVCKYIKEHTLQSWKIKNTIMLLARVIGGARFQRHAHFDTLERQTSRHATEIFKEVAEIEEKQFRQQRRQHFRNADDFMNSL